MALKVVERDYDVGVDNRRGDVGFVEMLEADLDLAVIVALEAVGDDHGAAQRRERISVFGRRQQVACRVRTAPFVQRVGVRRERFPAPVQHHARDTGRIVVPQKGKVARLAEVDFDRDELVFHGNIVDARSEGELIDLVDQAVAVVGVKIGEVNARI